MKIDLLAAGNQYGTGLHFARGLADALERQGSVVRRFWIDDGYFSSAMHEILQDPPDLTCSFADISFQRLPLGSFWQIPHLSWLVDPPIYFLHQMQGPYSYIACIDQKDALFVEKLPFPRVTFLPHAADKKHLTEIKKERPYKSVFFGSCIDYEEIAKSWPDQEKELLLEASRRVLSPEGLSIAEVLIDLGIPSHDLPCYHGEVDRYTRGKDRVELIRSFPEAVHIWGEGPWKKYLPSHPIHPAIPFDETLALMKESQLVLNSTPRFKAGAHERLFYALLCGAAVYTGENSYLSKELPEAYFYQFGHWQAPSFDDWKVRALAGQERVLASHTWEARATTCYQYLKKYISISL